MVTATKPAPAARAGARAPSETTQRATTRCARTSPPPRDRYASGASRPEVLGRQDAQGAA